MVITLGGAPNHDRIGFRYWSNPGAWTDFAGITGPTGHFLGFISAFINASFSFIGVETVSCSTYIETSCADLLGCHRRCRDTQSPPIYSKGHKASHLPNPVLLRARLHFDRNDRAVQQPRSRLWIRKCRLESLGHCYQGRWNPRARLYRKRKCSLPRRWSLLTNQACILVSAWSAGNSYCYVGSRIIVAMAVDKQLPQVSVPFLKSPTLLTSSFSQRSTDGVFHTTPCSSPLHLVPSHTSVS